MLKCVRSLEPRRRIGEAVEAVSFDDTLGEIGKVVKGGLSEDQVIPVNSIDMYEVIADFERGTRAHRKSRHKIQDCGPEGKACRGSLAGGKLGTDKGGRYRPQLARSGRNRAPFHRQNATRTEDRWGWLPTAGVVAWLAQKRSVARTKDNVKVRKESPGFWTEEMKRVEM